ncbi:MAG: ThuA domain-containing protein [Verrucomicrobiales bacterium]|nr:ThuA domain-containing protein [Verrucomicrobiales bacterium]
MMIPRSLFCVAALLWSMAGQAAELTVTSLNGRWSIEAAELNGTSIPGETMEAFELALKEGTYELKGPDLSAKGTFTVDAAKSPAAMDVKEVEGPNAGRTIPAIVEWTASGMRICYALEGGSRPTAFRTEAGGGQFLASYRRKGGVDGGGVRPIRALMISGGCCHDYEGQDRILSEGISKRARVDWTIVRDAGQTGTKHKVSAYQKEDWAAGFDIVVHNECFSDEKELEWLERIVKPHREGVPAVVIHCAMHCYRAPTNDWFRFVGVTSHGHGSHFAYPMTNVKPEHPIMKGFPAVWQTPKEELYNIASIEKTATPLATGYSPETKRGEANVWVNTFGKARVFGTTVGHYNHTMQEPVYLDLVARGLLWAAGKLGDDGEPLPGYAGK